MDIFEEVPIYTSRDDLVIRENFYLARLEITAVLGMHARPATEVQTAAKSYDGDVTISNLENGRSANGKEIMGLMMLEALKGNNLGIKFTKGQEGLDGVVRVVESMKCSLSDAS